MATNNKNNTEKEEKKREKEKVKFSCKNKISSIINTVLFNVSLLFLATYLLIRHAYKLLDKTNPFAKLLYKLDISVPEKATTFIIEVFAVCFVLSILIFFLKLMPPSFDFWIKDIAFKRLSTTTIYFDRKYLYIEYDIALKNQDVKDFISEISNKSNSHSYYLLDISIDDQVVIIVPGKKKNIPTRCALDKNEDTAWNIIPLGEAVNNQLKTITPIGWWLNDNIIREDVIKTLPSTSLMIAGGTGSGKSVVENGIIGHITRFPDNIQGLLIDVKKVEFGGLEAYKGIKKVGTTIEDCSSIIEQARKIMYDRFTFMEKNGVNNVYKLENSMDVNYFSIKGETFQFDEIFDCKIGDKSILMTLDLLYNEIQNVERVEIIDYNFKGLTEITKNDIIKTKGKFKPKAVLILVDELGEVMNDSNYRVVSSIQTNIGSIARLGRAAGVHLCLATQRPSGDIINADLKNNIQMGVLLGDFDSGASSLIFDKDISDISKPEIKGRGYVRSGKDIVEFQSYWTEKDKDFSIKKDHNASQDVTFADVSFANRTSEDNEDQQNPHDAVDAGKDSKFTNKIHNDFKIEVDEVADADYLEPVVAIQEVTDEVKFTNPIEHKVLKLNDKKPAFKLNKPVVKEDTTSSNMITIVEDKIQEDESDIINLIFSGEDED